MTTTPTRTIEEQYNSIIHSRQGNHEQRVGFITLKDKSVVLFKNPKAAPYGKCVAMINSGMVDGLEKGCILYAEHCSPKKNPSLQAIADSVIAERGEDSVRIISNDFPWREVMDQGLWDYLTRLEEARAGKNKETD